MKQSLHSPLSRLLRRTQQLCTHAAETGIPVKELVDVRAEQARSISRRALLAFAATAAASTIIAPSRVRAAGNPPRVVIVGSGLAGLACARSLWLNNGIPSQIFEWDTHIGGRVETLRNFFANGLVAEQHGEFISSEHHRMRSLAAYYGLELENTDTHLGNTEDTYYFAGQRYTAADLASDWQTYAWALFRDAVRQAPSATYKHANAQARIWDNMSVTDWVDQYIPGGVQSPFGALCLADVISEYGGPPEQQSALNLIYILGYDASSESGYQPRNTPLVAGSDEKWHVRGGNDQIVYGIANELPQGTINLLSQLLAVKQTGSTYVCTFDTPSGTMEVPADHVVLAIPPTTLRDVELIKIELSPVQRLALANATLGNNAKIELQVAGRPWIHDVYDGNLLTDTLVCGGWDAGTYQPGGHAPHVAGLYFGFPGGTAGQTLARRYGLTYGNDELPAPPQMVADTLVQLEAAFPGITAAWQAGPQLAYVNDGNIDPHLRGAYSYFRVGQYTQFAGAQSLPAGNVHFAGEHTSLQFQGYMEGAVQSGERAAAEITG
jgi:monoamine oxidase